MLINYDFRGNYDYYHNLLCVVYLLCSHKKFFAQLVLVFCYFLSVAAKIHPSWILGQYFTSLKTGLPMFPFGSEIVMTNLVMVMETVGAWFLFSRNYVIQRSVLVFFIVFHLYSGLLVGYRYPTTVLPPLLILFGPWFRGPERVPIDGRSFVGWSLMGVLLFGQMLAHTIEGDEKLTLEANFYGMYMFEANHQCYGHVSQGQNVLRKFVSTNAKLRCDPYEFWFRAKNTYCSRYDQKYQLVFVHSINGNPFREIVNELDLCKLEYHPFSRNAWIKDEHEAPTVARPVQNGYR
jgi:hypothetical protein